MHFILRGLQFAITTIAAGCVGVGGVGCSAPSSRAGETRVAELSEPVKQLDEVISALVDGTADSLTFRPDAGLDQIVVGDVVVSADAAAPFLRRVTERAVGADGNITLRTEDVGIDEVFAEADVSVYAEFLDVIPADGVEVHSQSLSSKVLAGPQGKTIPVAKLDLTFKLNDHRGEGSFNVKLDLAALLEMERPRLLSLERVKTTVIADYEFGVGLSFKAAEFLNSKEWRFPLATYPVVFWVGLLPVYAEIELVAELSGDMKAAVSVAYKGHIESGGEWRSGEGWKRVHDHKPLVGEGKAQGEVSLGIAAVAYMRILRFAGPKISFGPSFTASISSLDACTVDWDLALKGEAALELAKFFKDEELEDKSFAFEYKEPLTNGKFKLCERDKPAAPSNLQAGRVGDEDRIALSWKDNSTDEARFLIQWFDGAASWREIAYVGADAVGYAHENPSPGADNLYKVFAVGNEGTLSDPSNEVGVTLEQKLPPATPTALSATAQGDSQIVLAWVDGSSDEKGFVIERAVGAGGFEVYSGVEADVAGFADRFVERDQTYTYRVRAYGAGGLSDYSNQATARTSFFNLAVTVPAAPSNLVAGAASQTEISLSWSDNSGVETSQVLERAPENGRWAVLATLAADVASYHDTGLTPGATYHYRLRARNALGESADSNTASARTLTSSDGNTPEPTPTPTPDNSAQVCAALVSVSISHMAFDADVTVGESKTFSASASGALQPVEFVWTLTGGASVSPSGSTAEVTGTAVGAVMLSAEARDTTYGCVLGSASITINVGAVATYSVYRVPAICETGQLEVFNDQAYATGIPMCTLGGGGLDCAVMVVAEPITAAFATPEEAVQALCPRITGYIHGYWWDYVGVDGTDHCFGSLGSYDDFWSCAPD